MKPVNIFFKKITLMLVAMFLLIVAATAQDADEVTAAVKRVVEARTFTFCPTTAIAISASSHQLTVGYKLDISGDTLTADLPYFGNGYTAPVDAGQVSIVFTTTNFEYTATPRKKGSWKVQIKMKGSTEVREMFLDISATGKASLQIISNNRQPISYTGYIIEPEKNL